MTPHEFIAKWKLSTLTERSACQQHFLDLCELLEQPKPATADPEGAFYTFERGVTKTTGEHGWADVWFRDHFGWEYKGSSAWACCTTTRWERWPRAYGSWRRFFACDESL